MDFVKPSQQKLNNLIKLYQSGQYVDAEKLSLSITKEFPEHPFAWKILAVVLQQTGRIKESLFACQKSIQLDPQDSSAHNNLGNVLKQFDRLKEAEISYRKAIQLKPDFFEAKFNLGNLLKQLGKLEEAETIYKKLISLKPDFAEGYYGLGLLLQQNGRIEEAISAFTKSIDINPHFLLSINTLVRLLTIYTPKEESSHPIIKVNKDIKKFYKKENFSGMISDNKVIQIFCKSTGIIKENSLKLESNFSQIYRQNTIDLNCKRHKTIFNKFNIIPKFCFECYKVQVEPKSILELIKLAIVFDQIKLANNNTRKCMIELRSQVSGFYKGLIYCSSLEEAYQIAEYLEVILKENIEAELHVAVKRGCSEYAISFPDYKLINKSGPQKMTYNKDWKLIEKQHDSSNSKTFKEDVPPSIFGLNLNDILIIQNWIDYAKGIGDPSAHLLKQNKIFSSRIYKIAKTRIKKYPWQNR